MAQVFEEGNLSDGGARCSLFVFEPNLFEGHQVVRQPRLAFVDGGVRSLCARKRGYIDEYISVEYRLPVLGPKTNNGKQQDVMASSSVSTTASCYPSRIVTLRQPPPPPKVQTRSLHIHREREKKGPIHQTTPFEKKKRKRDARNWSRQFYTQKNVRPFFFLSRIPSVSPRLPLIPLQIFDWADCQTKFHWNAKHKKLRSGH